MMYKITMIDKIKAGSNTRESVRVAEVAKKEKK
jgi:hypothetical protein